MLNNPYFSIIVPTFNSTKTLPKTIRSVLTQKFSDFEMLIIDDGSSDNTEELINSFEDSRIIYRKITNSGGPARPRNIGLQLARGSWVCFLDSDDLWVNNKLEETFKHIMSKPEVDVWTSGYFIFDESGVIFERFPSKLVNKFSFKTLLIYSNPFVTSALSIRKDKVGSINFDTSKDIASVEDLGFLIDLSIKKLKAEAIEFPLVYYFHNEDGISKNYINHLNNLKNLFKKYSFDKPFFFKIRVISNYLWIKSSIELKRNNYLIFSYNLFLSILLSPIDRVTYIFKYFRK